MHKKLKKSRGFKLTSQKRTTKKVPFSPLAKMTQEMGIELDLSVTLTKQLQKELGDAIAQLPSRRRNHKHFAVESHRAGREELPFNPNINKHEESGFYLSSLRF
jgi:ribonuclease D